MGLGEKRFVINPLKNANDFTFSPKMQNSKVNQEAVEILMNSEEKLHSIRLKIISVIIIIIITIISIINSKLVTTIKRKSAESQEKCKKKIGITYCS